MQIIWLFGILIIVIIFYLFDISIIKLCQILWKKKISNKIYPDSKKDLKYIDGKFYKILI